MMELQRLTKKDTSDLAAVDFMLNVERGLNLTGPELSSLFAVRRLLLHGSGMRINSNSNYELCRETLSRVGLISILINALEAVIPEGVDVYSILNEPIENKYFAGHSIRDCLLTPNLQIADLVNPRDLDIFAH
jgi:hypothetical protein